MTERERDAIRLLQRIRTGEVPGPIYEDAMYVEAMDVLIDAYLSKYGPFDEQLREGDE